MQDNNSTNSTLFVVAVKSILVKSLLAAILGLIIYMSVLFIYRSFAHPTIVGYTVTTINEEEKSSTTNKYFFKENEEAVLPKADDTHFYNALYGRDAFPEILSQLLIFVIFSIMIYDAAWQYGAKMGNAVSFGRAKRNVFEGIKLGAYSNVVGYIAYLLLLFSKLGLNFKFALPVFSIVNAAYLPLLNATLISELPVTGFSSITQSFNIDTSFSTLLVMLIPLFLKILVSFIGYELGYRQISIKDKILYKDKTENL